MRQEHDVIICGGGPAGATAATVLAREGHRVLVLDRARFPRKKLCGGLLTWKSMRLLESVFGESPESLVRAGIINHFSDRYTVRSLDAPLAAKTLAYPFHFVDRQPFDAHLLGHAKAAGATILEKAKVVLYDAESSAVILKTGEIFSAPCILGADGAHSVVRKAFSNIDRARFRENMGLALEIAIDPNGFPRHVTDPELVVGFLDAGYGWIFPNKDRLVIGICGLRQKGVNFAELFTEYLLRIGVNPDYVSSYHGHALPYGNYLAEPVHSNALLAGDAGGFVEPLLGEGIFYALCTGLYAGEAMDKGLRENIAPGPHYLRRLHAYVLPELAASNTLRWALFRAMRLAGTNALSLFLNAAASRLEEMVHGMRSYSWLRKKQWDF